MAVLAGRLARERLGVGRLMTEWIVTYERAAGCCGGSEEMHVRVVAPNASHAVAEARAIYSYDIKRILMVQKAQPASSRRS